MPIFFGRDRYVLDTMMEKKAHSESKVIKILYGKMRKAS
jgi:hypothetical protein